jgi:exopolysaccharide biosynthesis polyprenyl glycosylphosphotransferase
VLRYNLRYGLFLVLSDILLVFVALGLSSFLRINLDLGAEPLTEPAFLTPPPLYGIAVLIWLFAFQQAGVYRAGSDMRFRTALRRVLTGHMLGGLLFFGALYITFRDYSRLQSLYFLVLLLVGVVAHRAILRLLRPYLRRFVNNRRTVIIVGTSESAAHLRDVVYDCREAGLTFAGFVKLRESDPVEPGIEEQILGTADALPTIIQTEKIDEILVDAQWFDLEASRIVARLTRVLDAYPVNIRLAHDYSELAYFRATSEDFNGVTLIALREAILTPAQRIFKRLFDIVFSASILLLGWPLFIIIGLAIKLDSPGPVLYTQQRIGQHSKPFTIYKFRTMYVDAGGDHPSPKRPGDPRVTRVGRFLRRTSLDELPQFINVLRGEMSVVGPRPEMTWLVDEYEWWQRKRFEVPQGITGWWQVSGRSDKPMHLHTEDDLFYVRNYSLWLDVQIIFKTIVAMITGKGAY